LKNHQLPECELWYGRLQGAKNVVLIAVAEGVGAAILAGGQLHSGFNGLAGEFGHISVDPRGQLCGCGQKGCWEMESSSRAALRAYQAIAKSTTVHNFYDLLKLAEDGDVKAMDAIAQQAQATCTTCGFYVQLAGLLGMALGVCTNEFSPADGRVVDAEYGCGAHSDTVIDAPLMSASILSLTSTQGESGWPLLVSISQRKAGFWMISFSV